MKGYFGYKAYILRNFEVNYDYDCSRINKL